MGSRFVNVFCESMSRTTSAMSDSSLTRHVRHVHPSQLDVRRVLGEVVCVQISHTDLEHPLPVEGEAMALREGERYREYRKESVLDPERSRSPYVIYLGYRYGTV